MHFMLLEMYLKFSLDAKKLFFDNLQTFMTRHPVAFMKVFLEKETKKDKKNQLNAFFFNIVRSSLSTEKEALIQRQGINVLVELQFRLLIPADTEMMIDPNTNIDRAEYDEFGLALFQKIFIYFEEDPDTQWDVLLQVLKKIYNHSKSLDEKDSSNNLNVIKV